jgi:phosphoacetylglucosamine mutase
MKEFAALPGIVDRLDITFLNDDKAPTHLNDDCGAEHVHAKQSLPTGWSAATHEGLKCISFDGDADRQIYYYGDAESKYQGANGDKQFALIMMYIRDLLQKAGISDKVSHILVQTAYCNSRSTAYLNQCDINNQLVKTGVKYAHPVVVNYDIGANTEPNGHGTVAYKMDAIEAALAGNDSVEAQKLKALLTVSNAVVGDSVANLLVLECILYDLDYTIQDFVGIYSENPNRLYKIKVDDRSIFKPIADESRLTEPAEIQQAVDAAVAAVQDGKAFLRPSGTEDVLRLYAEAKTEAERDQLADTILKLF